ncbi:V-type ATP synthase subunit I [Natronoglomus mannanivorans]|uniref:A-type ATP synthase subunit I n=1 Tax=Natronoglomus mannanivorans TaxID=2979990 RepID=A0AAP3E1H6_9EURY|nr:V-type ATP synthase subunit I [Halobacteria archaeon AArc-xg1-1]
MLRPERMSKVSVTGSKGVMPTVIETVHELNLLHLSDYDGSWQGFDNGDPIEGAEDASGELVTVRALESTLNLDADEADSVPDSSAIESDWRERLERVRTRINELDDQRGEVREELRQVEERIDRVEPFAELGIDLDLLTGYDSVDVLVGEGSVADVEAALAAADEVRAYETFTGGDVVAIVAAPADGVDDEGLIDDALVGQEFTRHALPDTDQSPTAYVDELTRRKHELESDIEEIDTELEEIKREEGSFLLALEEKLTIEVQRAEAPLQFATTERAFVAEGWIPSEYYDEFVTALSDAVGDSVEIEEIERAEYDRHGAPTHAAPVPDEGGPAVDTETDEDAESESESEPQKAATDGGQKQGQSHAQAGAAGGSGAVTMDDEPPVVLDNLRPARPFEMMVKMVSQPKYSELDPTLLIFLTYPFAFGFMIGDIGYGILYMAMGYVAYQFDSDAMKAIGTIGLWAGAFTTVFGYLYDDIFGVHMADLGLEWLPLAGSLTKGLQATEWAMLWIVLSLVFGLIHLNLGLIVGFVNELSHGLKAAMYEKGSWILTMNGLFVWIFSLHLVNEKPDFIVGEESMFAEFLGFTGLPEVVGIVGLVALVVGFVMVGIGEGIAGLFEWPAWAFGHVLSYLRMVAVLLAKGGMAFAVNLLVFGGYSDETGYTAFNLPTYDVAGYEQDFVGLVHMDPVWIGIPLAIVVFVLGHILVLLLGITAAGIQMLRLEYVEFFQKFYEGGGEEYEPFGHDSAGTQTRSQTAD